MNRTAHIEGLEQFLRRTVLCWIMLPVGFLLVLTIGQTLLTVRLTTLSRQREVMRYSLDVIDQHTDALLRELVRANEIGLLVSAPPAEARRVLRTLMNRSGRFEQLLLRRTSGEVIAQISEDQVILGEERSGLGARSLIEEARRTAVPLLRTDVGPKDEAAFLLAVPIVDLQEGAVRRVLIGRSSFDHLSVLLSQMPNPREHRVEVHIGGAVVAANSLPRYSTVLTGRSATSVLLGERRQKLTIGTQEALVRVAPASLRPLLMGTATIIPFFLVFLVTLIAYAKVLGAIRRHVIGPIRRLGESMAQVKIGSGTKEQKGALDTVIGELRELGERFYAMRDRNEAQYLSLKRAMQANESLLQEVHHRVKNNLQVIKSLLHLQIQALQPDDEESESYKVFEVRVGAMALVHQHVQSVTAEGKLRLDNYLQDLASDVVSSFHDSVGPVGLTVEAQPLYIPFEPASLLGQIAAEALANAMRHAFPRENAAASPRNRVLSLSATHVEGIVRLSVSDNGVGFDQEEASRQQGVGLKIMEILAEDLDGVLSLHTGDEGTIVETRFPLPQEDS